MYKCLECQKEFETKNGLITHLQKKHKFFNVNDYDSKYKYRNYILEHIDIPKCEICGINDIYVNSFRGSHICNNPNCKHQSLIKMYYTCYKVHIFDMTHNVLQIL